MAVGLLGGLKRAAWLTAALMVLVAASFIVAWYDLKIGGKILGVIFGYPTFWARLLPYFVAGMTFHAWGDRIRYTGRGAFAAVLLIALGCAVPFGLIFVLPAAAAYLILWLAFFPTGRLQHFARHGDYSYGIFLHSFPLSQVIAHWTGPTSPLLLFALARPASIAAGALSWHLIERRFLKIAGRQHVLAGFP